MILKKFLHLYLAPAGDDGAATDRGDDWTPSDDVLTAPDAPKKPDTAADDAAKKLEDELEQKTELDPDAKKDSRIPLKRHEAVLAKERERREDVERELAKYQGGQKVAQTNEVLGNLDVKIVAMEKEYAALLADGKIDDAVTKMAEIRAAERESSRLESDARIQAAEARTAERMRYDTALDRMEAAYPEINPDHEDFDKDTFAEIVELKMAYQARGRTPTEAMQKAVKLILGADGSRQAKAVTVKPTVDADEVTAAAKKDVAAERKAAAVEKALATKQPANTDKIGQDSDRAGKQNTGQDVIKMSQKDFAELAKDEKALAKMRGDDV